MNGLMEGVSWEEKEAKSNLERDEWKDGQLEKPAGK